MLFNMAPEVLHDVKDVGVMLRLFQGMTWIAHYVQERAQHNKLSGIRLGTFGVDVQCGWQHADSVHVTCWHAHCLVLGRFLSSTRQASLSQV